jgi:hypothetical protein
MMKNPDVRKAGIAAALFVGLMTLLAACGGGGGGQEDAFPGSVYAQVVPVYPGAKYIGTMGGSSSESIGGPASSQSQSWFFKTSDTAEDVVAFYKKKLPGAELEIDGGDSTFTLIPKGAEEGEQVQVIFHNDGNLQIHESVKAGKKQS